MNSKVFSITGWTLMILGILVPAGMIIMQIFQIIQRNSSYLGDIIIEGFFPSAIIFILVFLPGLKYYKLSKGKSNSLENWAVGLMLSTLILEVLLLGVLSLGSDSEGIMWGMAIFGGLLLIPYCIGVLLLIINWIADKIRGRQ